MRRVAVALAVAGAAVASACTTPRPIAHPEGDDFSYNRRELPPAQGLFSGPDGNWTVYRNDAPKPPPAPAAAPKPLVRETLLCQRGQDCDPPLGGH
jgi:hypothetical protein